MKYKVVIVGDSAAGKTSILNRYVYEKFCTSVPTTLGVDFTHKEVSDDTDLVLWDTAGQERFQSITSSLYRGAHAVMFVYDVSSPDSFYNLEKWYREYRSFGNTRESVAMLVGNKADLERKVSLEEAKAWAAVKNMCYEEVSAKNNQHVKRAFSILVNRLNNLPFVRKQKFDFKNKPKSDRCCY
jgi:small GTP-binding protein